MKRIATWLREVDGPIFGQLFEAFPDLQLEDARLGPVDVEQADGLLLSGGEDVSLPYLRQPVGDPSVIEDFDAARDAWEFFALQRALDRGLPVLAICRGHQVLNVVLDGTLHLDIRGHNLPEQKRNDIQPLAYEREVPPWRRYGQVNSSHHQSIDRLGRDLVVEARAEDGTVEQVVMEGRPFVVGVQYHPERGGIYLPLFEAFAAAVRG
jgi:putative glutamine amidotransferase